MREAKKKDEHAWSQCTLMLLSGVIIVECSACWSVPVKGLLTSLMTLIRIEMLMNKIVSEKALRRLLVRGRWLDGRSELNFAIPCSSLVPRLSIYPLPPLFVGRKTLVAAGHVTTCETTMSTRVDSTNNFCRSATLVIAELITHGQIHLWNSPVLF